jgi:GntR family transcriptional regulator/MocR family aminotransferase
MPIVLRRGLATPLQRQIYDQFRQRILTGVLRGGQKMPSTRELSTTLAVARTTVTAAYDQLIAEGYLSARHGSGTVVSAELPEQALHARRPSAARPSKEVEFRLSAYAARLQPIRRPVHWEPGVINLSKYGPDLECFPFSDWRRLIARHLRDASSAAFEYSGSATGHEPLRREIAAYVARSRAVACVAEQVIIANGSQQALDLCARLLLNGGDEVVVENPGYVGARQLFVAHGAVLRPTRLTSEGIAVADFSPRTRLVHVTPSHQLPTGVSMSLARRLALLEWARPRGVVILEDDYDSVYRYSGAPLPSLQSLAAGTAVIYIGTFSNVMFPGLRLGYLVVPLTLVQAFARAKWLSDRQTASLEQAALADFLCEGHLERHVRRMRRLYGRRREAMVDALVRHFGSRVEICGEPAGMHMTARFASDTVLAQGPPHRVRLTSTRDYYVGEAPAQEFLFCFAGLGERTIREGVRRLAAR